MIQTAIAPSILKIIHLVINYNYNYWFSTLMSVFVIFFHAAQPQEKYTAIEICEII